MEAEVSMALASDAELASAVIAAGAAGMPAAEAELCRRFGRRVRLYGRSRLREPSTVDDLVQRVMLVVLTKLRAGEIRSPDRIDSFILGTARLCARELSRPRDQPAELDTELPCPLSETRPDPLELQRLGECLKGLAERDRAIVSLSFFQEQTAEEVGEALGMAAGNVRVTRHRALSRLRGCMGLGTEETTS
ncbi:MAG TPA: sigma-70 family RNA polymerase sigma factor [Polyangiaceae bacterium]|nr:sigma-70 family RNA polymerase sigma factor [Polyangiaceae bacterium]